MFVLQNNKHKPKERSLPFPEQNQTYTSKKNTRDTKNKVTNKDLNHQLRNFLLLEGTEVKELRLHKLGEGS